MAPGHREAERRYEEGGKNQKTFEFENKGYTFTRLKKMTGVNKVFGQAWAPNESQAYFHCTALG